MIAVIGEMAVSFIPAEGSWEREFSGLGYEWAARLREMGKDVLLLTVLPHGRTGRDMADELVRLGVVFDPDMRAPLNPAVVIDGEWLLKGSAPVSLSTEKLSDAFSYFSDIESVVVSGTILSYNPAASAVLDAVSFMNPLPRVAVDTGYPEAAEGNASILERTLSGFRASVPGVLISSDRDEVLSLVR